MSPWTPVFQFLGIDQFVVSTIILCLLFTFVGLALGAFLCNGTKNKKAALARASSAMAALLIAAIVARFHYHNGVGLCVWIVTAVAAYFGYGGSEYHPAANS